MGVSREMDGLISEMMPADFRRRLRQRMKNENRIRDNALFLAVFEWYQGLEEAEKQQVDSMVIVIMQNVKIRNGGAKAFLGEQSALEVLGAILAVENGWIKAEGRRRG